jgi:hypothetical protein
MKVTLCCFVTLLFAVSCWAQKNEVDMVLGNTWSFNSNTSLSLTTSSGPFFGGFRSGQNSNLTYELGLARRLTSFGPTSFSLELTSAGFPANLNSGSFGSVFIVPGAKFSFLPRSTVSPFVSSGVGYVHLAKGGFAPTNAIAFQFGGGADVKTPVRFLKLRAEARDFLASQSGLGNIRLLPGEAASGSHRNHLLLGGGVAFHF